MKIKHQHIDKSINYIPGLNGLRAIAVFFVIISHRFPKEHFVHIFPLGDFGVDMFFTLSGFLISRILFQQLKRDQFIKKNKLATIKHFMFRRFLRIFPIYYMTLFFLYLTKGIIGNYFVDNILWYTFYCANYLNFFKKKWFGSLSHLWTLSVEEQFYIIWPFLLFFVFKKRISLILFLFIAVGTIYPFFFGGFRKVLTIGCLNAFGVGALLAYVEIMKPNYKITFLNLLNRIFIPLITLLVINYCFYQIPYFPKRLMISVLTIVVIAYCRYNSYSRIVQKVLENKTLYFIGMISYGIYLYHNLIPKYWRFGLMKLGFKTPALVYEFSYIEFLIQTLLIILISYLSWIWIEKPILKLKRFFEY